ncbi:hypothetical protein A2U01_0099755, partial [Trifolium medium]|nr:hypothetical protein [Trifolium medium]
MPQGRLSSVLDFTPEEKDPPQKAEMTPTK